MWQIIKLTPNPISSTSLAAILGVTPSSIFIGTVIIAEGSVLATSSILTPPLDEPIITGPLNVKKLSKLMVFHKENETEKVLSL